MPFAPFARLRRKIVNRKSQAPELANALNLLLGSTLPRKPEINLYCSCFSFLFGIIAAKTTKFNCIIPSPRQYKPYCMVWSSIFCYIGCFSSGVFHWEFSLFLLGIKTRIACEPSHVLIKMPVFQTNARLVHSLTMRRVRAG